MKTINDIIRKYVYETYGRGCHVERELILSHLRYEALRILTPQQYRDMCKRNIKGENFDSMVDELIIKNNE